MKISNNVSAPIEFIERVVAAVKLGEGFFSNRFNIEFIFNNIIEIEDEDLASEMENRKRCEEIRLLINELSELLELLSIVFSEYELYVPRLLEKIRRLIDILMGEIDSDILYLSKDIQKEIEKILNEGKRLAIDNELFERIRKKSLSVKKRAEGLRFPIVLLGCYCHNDGKIKLFYQSIKKVSQKLNINEVGANVTVHELFHAAHFSEMNYIDSKPELRGELSQLRREAVIETLAESACLEYAKTFQSKDITEFVRNSASAHPLPYWGYYGALIIEKHNTNFHYQDILFKSIYYASLLNTNKAYYLIFS